MFLGDDWEVVLLETERMWLMSRHHKVETERSYSAELIVNSSGHTTRRSNRISDLYSETIVQLQLPDPRKLSYDQLRVYWALEMLAK